MPILNRWRPALTAGALVLVTAASTGSEPLYMPRAVKAAFAHGTRSPDGRPGPRYWQNHGRYTITVTARPPAAQITGSERITYINNSPDSLRSLVFKLLLNIHKPGAPRDGGAGPDYLTSGVHIDSFSVNGRPATWPNNPQAFTVQQVHLSAPLLPHDSVNMAVAWHYDLSKESGREGMIDSTTWFLAYFYPRVAVYDDYDGWDRMDFTDQQEFYSDFNDYDVTIRAPKNYVVWGTGTLTNSADLLTPTVLQRFRSSFSSDATVHVVTLAEMKAGQVTRQDSMNAWHFTATNVPDMTYNLSDHYVWDAGSVVVDAARPRVSVQAAYNDTAADYHYMVQFGRHALDWLSHHWPGVPYPYEKTTVVQGFADMEYPMMVNDGSTPDTTFSRFVVEHEIAHTWFPFYMGINETRYGFMDEGWATTFEYLINLDDMGKDRASTFYKQFRVSGWIRDPSPLEDLPIITPEDVIKNQAYGNNAYGKPSLGYLAVKDLLGDEVFGKSLREFISRWHGKHPIPWDFFNTMNDATGKDLNWFWRNWFFSNNYIDLALGDVVKTAAGYTVTINNIGGMAAPVDFLIKYSDGSADTLHQTPAIWAANQMEAKVSLPTRKTIQSLTLDGGIWMDADTTNNGWTGR
ncbi:MAG: M1 family metallopeptidase [Gemmatimonadota bacterium]